MQKATFSQRFVAFIIDTIITSIVISLITVLYMSLRHISSPKDADLKVPTDNIAQVILDTSNARFSNKTNFEQGKKNVLLIYMTSSLSDEELFRVRANIDDTEIELFNNYYDACKQYTNYQKNTVGVNIVAFILVVFLYYDVFGYYMKFQTVGRLFMKIKVVDTEGEKPTFGRFIVRDVLGYAVLMFFNACCFLPVIINLVYLIGKDKLSIGDRLSNTMMVRYDSASTVIDEEQDEYDE